MNNLEFWDLVKYDFVICSFMFNYNDYLKKFLYEN